ncbi:MAG: hypothetical protein ACD_75C01294G0001, partial [uncultured bacterium]
MIVRSLVGSNLLLTLASENNSAMP